MPTPTAVEIRRYLTLGGILAAVCISLGGDCGDLPSTPRPEKDIEILLHNADPAPVHMFLGDGQTFPCCQVESQGTRTEQVKMSVTSVIHFHAGRNGELLAFRKVCTLGDAGFNAGSVSVVYFDRVLTCMGW